MRATLILVTLLIFSVGMIAVDTGTAAECVARFRVTDAVEAPFLEPVLRLLPLPNGATSATARLAAEATEESGPTRIEVTAREPMVIRGLTVLPVVIASNTESDGSKAVAPSSLQIEVVSNAAAKSAPAPETSPLRYGRGFFRALSPFLPQEAMEGLSASEEGGYLIITHPTFLSAADSLAAWKRQQGFQVSVATTDQTGASNEQIRAYIQNQYRISPLPPEYVLLIGDVAFIPAFGFHGAVTDMQYALTDGDDFLPDLMLGRLSVQTLPQAENVVAKIVRYERDPYRGDGGRWMGRGLTVGKNFPTTTPVATSRWCRERMFDAGFAQVDSVYWPDANCDQDCVQADTISACVNEGVSLITYRGWAIGSSGWDGHFESVNVRSLQNGWKDPVVFSFVCHVNDFSEDECFGEAWLRVGSTGNPFGGVGFIGNSEPWSHTRFNDGAAIGVFDAIGTHGVRELGQILLAAKLNLLDQFPLEILWEDVPDGGESVEYYFYIYGLLGDPSMEIWCGAPKAIEVRHAEALSPAASFVEVAVADSVDGAPVPGLRVGVSRGGAVLGTGWTDEQGNARIPVALGGGADAVRITVTGGNVLPYRGSASVGSGVPYLSVKEAAATDDGTGQSVGNGDGKPNPGESLELRLTLHNNGSETAQAGVVRLVSLDQDEVIVGEVPTAAMAAGADQTLDDPLVLRIAPTRSDRFTSRFVVEAIAGADISRSILPFVVEAPALRAENPILSGEGFLSPGETFELSLSLRNTGSVPALEVSGTLHSRGEWAVVRDSVAEFDRIDPNGAAANTVPFRVEVPPHAVLGQAANFTLEWTTASGATGETSFSLPIGVATNSAPLGPDRYGYWAYDNSDTDYPAAPLYDWIECSTRYGGNGRKVRVYSDRTVLETFPDDFSFVYYGQSYDAIQISDNGWISFNPPPADTYTDFYNWTLPSTYGTGARVAPFWDNLDVYKGDIGGQRVCDDVYVLADSENHRFVIEWSRIGNLNPTTEGEELFYNDLQTFEIVLLDPRYYPTATGDGTILFQYKQIVNVDQRRMYSTVGIENPSSDDAVQYTFSNVYPPQAAPLSDGLAIKFTTEKPVYSPFRLSTFEALPGESGVLLSWTPIDERPRGGYRVYRVAAGEKGGPVVAGWVGPDARSFLDAGAHPDLACTYKIGSVDPLGRETLLGPFEYTGSGQAGWKLALSTSAGNPSRGTCRLAYTIPRKGSCSLRIYDVAGRTVRTLVDGEAGAGPHPIAWDGRDGSGHDLPGGIYFARLQAAGEKRELKLTLLR